MNRSKPNNVTPVDGRSNMKSIKMAAHLFLPICVGDLFGIPDSGTFILLSRKKFGKNAH